MKGVSIQANFEFRRGENLTKKFEKVYTSQTSLRKLFMLGSTLNRAGNGTQPTKRTSPCYDFGGVDWVRVALLKRKSKVPKWIKSAC